MRDINSNKLLKIKIEILEGNYWEHFKIAKDWSLMYPIDDQKRKDIEKTLNELTEEIQILKAKMK